MYISRKRKIFFVLILWRLLSVVLVQTAHVPDEYWQSLEVAHKLAFGYGYLTWEWIAKIRSYIYPFLIFLLYKMLAILQLDCTFTITVLPRLVHAVIAAYGDYRFYVWTKSKWMTFSLCINWYWYYCATRTIINSLETSLTIIALSIFPWRDSAISNSNYVWIIGFMTMARPTAAIIWMPLCLYHFCTSAEKKFVLFLKFLTICSICFILSTLLDCYCYGALVISSWQFFKVNVLQNVGVFYGKEHFFWYLFPGLPVLLGLYYEMLLIAIYQMYKHFKHFHRETVLLIVVIWTIAVYSFIPHKEFRFILPLLPKLIYISSSCTSHIIIRSSTFIKKLLIALLVLSNVVPGIYLCLIHQRGSLDVMKVMQEELNYENITDPNILFLTPCHATPLYSHLHMNVTIRFLTCEPNLEGKEFYMDEADQFFMQPMEWLKENYINQNVSNPSHIVTFDHLIPKISDYLEEYELIAKIFHTYIPQSNYGKHILVYKLKTNENLF
ncbi:GPI mannosyltransferase 3 [Prorops nasuta]|uniref:GPI mannosyltransferase 3 n=1 Tax=Prorops nasuta TaxID=863751 RepID=UPI0034CD0553